MFSKGPERQRLETTVGEEEFASAKKKNLCLVLKDNACIILLDIFQQILSQKTFGSAE